jgi:hypothetical protein
MHVTRENLTQWVGPASYGLYVRMRHQMGRFHEAGVGLYVRQAIGEEKRHHSRGYSADGTNSNSPAQLGDGGRLAAARFVSPDIS